jgi:propane monooxygenase coupling protein
MSAQAPAARPDWLEFSASHRCGITMNDSVEGRAVAHVMEPKPDVTVTYFPAIIRIDGVKKLDFDLNEISDVLGRELSPYDFQIEMSTHYGRMVLLDDKVLVFADPEDAAQYLAEGQLIKAGQSG